MAEKRKLLAEIEKCYKKIDEGVELFEEIMDKMHEANSDNQRDKYQDDLKKEIKKLQRLRDQVKNWQNSSDIKDKEKLNQYRKLIEQRMEQFKDVERENKTKPHSKLGLSAEEKLDPKEKQKSDTMDWIQTQIRLLNEEIDRSEMQVESLSNTETGKKRGKKEDLKSKNEKEKRLEELRHHLERLKWHIEKLEICMRMVSNESLDAKKVYVVLKEAIESYVEVMDGEAELKDIYDPDDAYDGLSLEKLCAQIGGVNLSSVDEEHRENGHELGIDTESGAVSSSRHGSGENGQPPSPAGRRVGVPLSMTSPHQTTSVTPEFKRLISKEPSLDRPKSPATTATTVPPPPPPGIPYNSVAAGRSTIVPVPTTPVQTTNAFSAPSTPVNNTPVTNNNGKMNSTIVAASTPVASEVIHSEEDCPKKSSENLKNEVLEAENELSSSHENKKESVSKETETENEDRNEKKSEKKEEKEDDVEDDEVEAPSTITTKKDSVTSRGSIDISENSDNINGDVSKTSTPSSNGGSQMTDESTLRSLRSLKASAPPLSTEPKRAHIPAWLGASPLGRAPNTQEYDIQLAALELAVTRTQLPLDSERPRNYLPKVMFPVPSYYAQTAPANADSLEYYLRLSPDTLFFIFYYMEGTRAQLLAAKALKKLSWRFHTKYLTWFQRHEEPKQITDDYEQGTYVYFDFEKWSQRKKESFTFEYKFLEDKELD